MTRATVLTHTRAQLCAICQSALVDPVTTTTCKHTFCRDCIERAISVNPQCPIDRSALTTGALRETEQLVRLVRCGRDCGCDLRLPLRLAPASHDNDG